MVDTYSFDVSSEMNDQEVINAVTQANKEQKNRFDLKNSNSNIDFQQKDSILILTSQDEFTLKSVLEILKNKLVKRGLSLKGLMYDPIENAQRGSVRQKIHLQQGINKEKSKAIVKDIKASNLKVQTQIMDDKVRVTGRKKDDLQAVMQCLKNKDYGIHMDFGNYR